MKEYNVFLRSGLISFDFPMSSKEALSLKIGLEIHPQVHLLLNKMSISLSEASKAMTIFWNFPSCLNAQLT